MGTSEFRVLGPVEVRTAQGPIALGGVRSRGVLAALLLDANRVVPVDDLVDAAWGIEAPASGRVQAQNRVSALRRALRAASAEDDLISTAGTGYLIRLADGQLDLDRFGQAVAEAEALRAEGRINDASDALAGALGLWRGAALDGLTTPYLRAAARRLEETRLDALERRVQLDLELGRHRELVAELTRLIDIHPYRERMHALLMLALYRAGRQADALQAYRRVRAVLAEQLGLEPGGLLRRTHEAVLRGAERIAVDELDEAPATVAHQPARELPPDIAGFTGRAAALEALDQMTPEGIVTISGTAGVGKTALAIRWAHRVADRFPDGQLYVNLRGYAASGSPVPPIEALASLLRSLGSRPEESPPPEVSEATARYRSRIAGRRMLVVLDDARSADQVRPLLPGGPGCLVVVTSRDRLAGLVAQEGARRLSLDVLTPDEAPALLAQVLGDDRVAAEPAAAAELAHACAYLPLALRIAAANLAVRPNRPIAEQAALLAEGNPLAALTVDGDEKPAVRAAFDLSYAAVPPPAQRLFRLLGLVAGPDFTPAAAAALAGTSTPAAMPLLDRLAGAHLIDEHAPGRFTFHDLLRRYARELSPGPEQ